MYDIAKTMNPPRTVEEVVKDFKDRRAAIIKALTKDVEEFYRLCDPNNPNLCLYGFPNQHWEVNLPPPSDLPEPRLGINFIRDTMTKHEWLSMVALHSDTWLYSIATYFATKFGFDKADKKRLFNKITDVPSIYDVMEGRTANRRAKIEYRGLPQHILDQEILSRLPVRDLLKYRSVCNTWRSLIDDSSFVSYHLRNYRNNSEASNLLVFCHGPRTGYEQALVRRGDTFRKVQELKNVYAFYNFMSYVNGVILVRKENYGLFSEIILWNPSINRVFNVPNSMFEAMRAATFVELGLGYDASCNDYKVVAIVYPKAESMYNNGRVRYRATAPGLVHVYTLDNDTWTTKHGVCAPPYWTIGKQVYVNGAIHWINFGPNVADDLWYKTKDSYVVLFDVEFEVFKYFELPNGIKSSDDEQKEKFPTVLGGLFAIFCTQETQHDIWVMTEYGVSDSWSKMYTFTLQIDKLLHFNSDGELLFAVNGKGIKSYNVTRKRVKDLAKTYSKSSKYTIYPYVESLVLLKEGTVKSIQVNDSVLHI